MESYDEKFVPNPFALNNTGVICHFNSLLQALASQPVFIAAVLKNAEYMQKTGTGKAMLNFIKLMFTLDDSGTAKAAKAAVPDDIMSHSGAILIALARDLAVRRPYVKFGASQESASEGLVHLLDMMEPPVEKQASNKDSSSSTTSAPIELAAVPGPGGAVSPTSVESPITRLFLHRYRCEVHCSKCKNVVSTMTDLSVQFNLFYFDKLREMPKTAEAFSEAIRRHVTLVEDYACDKCKEGRKTCTCDHCGQLRAAIAAAEASGAAKPKVCTCDHCRCKGTGYRLYRLSMIPEIAVCLFNLYRHPRPLRFVPGTLSFPAKEGGSLLFVETAAVEHFGSLSSGHYIGRGLRAHGKVYLFNDSAFPQPTTFVASPNTYIAMYHYSGCIANDAPAPAATPPSATAATTTATVATSTTTTTTARPPTQSVDADVDMITRGVAMLAVDKPADAQPKS